MKAPAALEARRVEKRFGRRPVLTGVSLAVRPGEVVGLCGENGSGKTTLVRILAGVLDPDAGEVRRPPDLGYVPQKPLLYDHLTVREHFAYFAAARGIGPGAWHPRLERLLDRYSFVRWADERAEALSEGTKQKLNLALALLCDPPVLLLDEPYGGFEWETYLRFWEHVEAMRKEGKAVVVVSHLFYDRARLDRILDLRGGRVVQA